MFEWRRITTEPDVGCAKRGNALFYFLFPSVSLFSGLSFTRSICTLYLVEKEGKREKKKCMSLFRRAILPCTHKRKLYTHYKFPHSKSLMDIKIMCAEERGKFIKNRYSEWKEENKRDSDQSTSNAGADSADKFYRMRTSTWWTCSRKSRGRRKIHFL